MRPVLRWTRLGTAVFCCLAFPADDLSTLTDVTDAESANEQLAEVDLARDSLRPSHAALECIPGPPAWQPSELLASAPLLLVLARRPPDPFGQAALRSRLPRPLIFSRRE